MAKHPLAALDIPTRARNALYNDGFSRVDDLYALYARKGEFEAERFLLRVPNIGQRFLVQLRAALESLRPGFSAPDERKV